MRAPIFTRTPDGLLVDSFPDETVITRELLEHHDPTMLERRWRTVTIRCLNATAVYRMAKRGPYPRSYLLRMV
jgi:hypothetical protein